MVNIVDPSYNAGGKAAIVTGGNNIVLENLDISGVTVPDGNGAAVRYDQGSLTLINDSSTTTRTAFSAPPTRRGRSPSRTARSIITAWAATATPTTSTSATSPISP